MGNQRYRGNLNDCYDGVERVARSFSETESIRLECVGPKLSPIEKDRDYLRDS